MVVAGVLLAAATALSESPWRKVSVTTGWTQEPNPDETGKSSAQSTKLLGPDTLIYKRMGTIESYTLGLKDGLGGTTFVNVSIPAGSTIYFSGTHCDVSGLCERYDVDRTDGTRATVAYGTNAPPPPAPSPVPNTGLVAQ